MNPEELKQYMIKYRESHRKEASECSKKYYNKFVKNNIEKIKERKIHYKKFMDKQPLQLCKYCDRSYKYGSIKSHYKSKKHVKNVKKFEDKSSKTPLNS